MNIFWLDDDVRLCAQYHCDKHVVKMILEYAQLMSTAHHVLDGELAHQSLYRATHVNHPCAVWVRESSSNYNAMYELFIALCREYTFRYGRLHLTFVKLHVVLATPPCNIELGSLTTPPQCMPEEFRKESVVDGYHNYYNQSKCNIALWTSRKAPPWFNYT